MKRAIGLILLLSALAGCSERNVYSVQPSGPDSSAADSCHGKSCEHKKDK